MATSAARMPLQHLRDLYGSGTLIGFSDGQLLARYATFKDGAAFEALVARHGAMVVATCRAILEHEHDIEDAFQATFLVLARKAASVRAGDALGGWLHRVAYRTAVQAKREVRKRRRLESELAAMRISDASRAGSDLDLCSIVHEEIERLPERERLPAVLCDLEGLTYEQAAGRLRCTVQVLCYRLSKARARLRERLVRRGVTATVLCAVTTASTASAMAAVPVAWTRAVVAAATGGPTSATVAALSQAMIKGILMLQLKIAAAAVLAAIALASVSVVALGGGRPDRPRAAASATAQGRFATSASGEKTEPRSDQSKETAVTFRGRVLGPDGRPVAGAKLYMTLAWGYPHGPSPSPEYARTEPDGGFQLAVPAGNSGVNPPSSRPRRQTTALAG
jgi:RNA polymerase sigma factor (sigma-70 family)